ncbi:peptidase M20 [Ammoniphilus oxalaticus]|uniref:Peptidase M20 n=1 Tax=Ammoniphilus oxalaticus TaxID=66863 RepID=A0A419SGS4_9BACL|nr:M20 family metallopeptidase [Ammoniphilus oxalaticus]RKD22987.1 peptidase M20 [Ammoniphilus oxalaticus]
MKRLNPMLQRLEQFYEEMVQLRRELHMYPELSFQEVETPRKIAAIHRELGLDVRTEVGGRGVVATLRGGKPGPTVALRADFDALPIQDEKEVDYKSRVPGVMHACGHDLHTATLIGVARVLVERKEELAGNVVFIHQFAEEVSPGGAKPMIEDGCLDDVDVIYGYHVWAGIPYGEVRVTEGYMMAAVDDFIIHIEGKGGHGATPHVTVDPIVVGSQLVLNLQQIVSRRVDPLKPAVLTVGSFVSGNAFNVIPGTAQLRGTIRSFDDDVRALMEQALKEVTEATCRAAGAKARIEFLRGYPAVNNHAEPTKWIEEAAKPIVGADQVKPLTPIMGGEDFAYYLQKVPGTFFFVGGENSELNAVYPHHHPKFDVDERAMIIGGKVFLAAVARHLLK